MKNYHLKFFMSDWALMSEHAEQAEITFTPTKVEALKRAADYLESLRRPVSQKIHHVSGRIAE